MNNMLDFSSFRPVIKQIQNLLAVGSLFAAKNTLTVYDTKYSSYSTCVRRNDIVLIAGDTFLFIPPIRYKRTNPYFHSVTPVLINEQLKSMHFGIGYLNNPAFSKTLYIHEMLQYVG